jgi:hypothetical protein
MAALTASEGVDLFAYPELTPPSRIDTATAT